MNARAQVGYEPAEPAKSRLRDPSTNQNTTGLTQRLSNNVSILAFLKFELVSWKVFPF